MIIILLKVYQSNNISSNKHFVGAAQKANLTEYKKFIYDFHNCLLLHKLTSPESLMFIGWKMEHRSSCILSNPTQDNSTYCSWVRLGF